MKNAVAIELSRIAREHGGKLLPLDVVESARPKDSPLHSKFTWDDTKAAQEHRLWQARQLISVTVIHLPNAKPTQMFVSLSPDRTKKSGGYRHIVDVLNDEQMTAQLLQDALDDMRRFTAKYRRLEKLAKVVEAMDEVLRKPTARALATT